MSRTESRLAAAGLEGKYLADDTPRLAVDVAALTHQGRVRESNEDHYAVIRRTRSQHVLDSNVPMGPREAHSDEAYLLLVADGVGGIRFGEVASQLALRTIWELADQLYSWVMKLVDFESQFDEIRERVTLAIQRIQRAFEAAGDANPELSNMGTTVTAAYIAGHDVILVNMGDSRAYLYRNGRLFQQTHDHTVAQECIDAGARPEEVTKVRNVLTRCLSAMLPDARPDIHYLRVQDADALLLCTDGLSDMLDADAIVARLAASRDARGAAQALVDEALKQGGRDNVTVIVAGLRSGESA